MPATDRSGDRLYESRTKIPEDNDVELGLVRPYLTILYIWMGLELFFAVVFWAMTREVS
jgi:hypothetical protein